MNKWVDIRSKCMGNECMGMICPEPKYFRKVCFKTVYFEEYSEYPFWVPLGPYFGSFGGCYQRG